MRKTALMLVVVLTLSLAVACNKARSDAALVTDIKAQMFSNTDLKNAAIEVTAQNGEVTLTGQVASDAVRYAAYKTALLVEGVKKVNDQMTVVMAQAAPLSETAPAPAVVPAPVRRVAKPRPAAPVQETASTPAAMPVTAQPVAAAPPQPPPPPQPKVVEIPAGTTVSVRMIDSIDSETDRTGQIFRGSLDAPVVVEDEIVVPAGTDVYVKLADARSAGRMTGRSELRLELVRMQFQGKSYTLASDEYEQVGTSRGKRTAGMVGGGAAIGAAIGAIAGGGKGAAIGAGVGAATGGGVQAATKGKQIQIPSETKIDFRLIAPVTVSYFPEKNKSRQ